MRRTNDELVAGWGNLVNRTATLIAKNFGEIPAAGELTAEDQALLDRVEAAFGTVGDLIGRHRQKAGDRRGDARVAEVNKYVSDTEPWKLKGDDQRERLGTVLHVVAQCVADLNRPLAVPAVHAPTRSTASSAATARSRRCRASRRSTTSTAARALPGHHRRLHARAGLGAHPLVAGTPVAKPTPVFTKLDPSVVDEELARLDGRAEPRASRGRPGDPYGARVAP